MPARAPASFLAVIALAMFGISAPDAAGTDAIRGPWIDHREVEKQKVAVWIEDCDDLLCGRIYWLKKPLSAGQPKRDRNNPDAALRDRPLCGLVILSGFRRAKDGSWGAGHIYNPSDGRTYSGTITLETDGSLRIRGYVGISLFGRTAEWVRPQGNLEHCG